ncbi:biopolymer transporter ExbD [Candidatus Cyanaurora vandensis]|uniref:ExbD/TolR family protein n=1 Tax=Candidatus Cyanaurora vandensis TaxID=2714958 RepID=UPI00257A8ABE|nr:biopolymer transporter ExbD [Candidatus Cyanaurora vandensis]
MRLPHLSDKFPEIPVVPLIDVMFTLLTFFIVATLFIEKSRAIELNLPKSATTASLDRKEVDQVDVSVDKDGNLYFNKDRVERAELLERIKAVPEKTLIILAGDELTEYADIVRAMDVIREADRGQVSLAARNLEGR